MACQRYEYHIFLLIINFLIVILVMKIFKIQSFLHCKYKHGGMFAWDILSMYEFFTHTHTHTFLRTYIHVLLKDRL